MGSGGLEMGGTDLGRLQFDENRCRGLRTRENKFYRLKMLKNARKQVLVAGNSWKHVLLVQRYVVGAAEALRAW
jgi:hypothetical protein